MLTVDFGLWKRKGSGIVELWFFSRFTSSKFCWKFFYRRLKSGTGLAFVGINEKRFSIDCDRSSPFVASESFFRFSCSYILGGSLAKVRFSSAFRLILNSLAYSSFSTISWYRFALTFQGMMFALNGATLRQSGIASPRFADLALFLSLSWKEKGLSFYFVRAIDMRLSSCLLDSLCSIIF